MIILLASEKGGVGKTTLATNLAAGFAISGQPTTLIDADPQQTASRWLEDRDPATPHIAGRQLTGNIAQALLADDHTDHVVIADTPGQNSAAMNSGLTVADIALLPLRPSQPDIDTLHTIAINIRRAKRRNPTLTAAIVLTMVPTHHLNREATEALAVLKNHQQDFHIARTRIHDRKAYRDAISEGRGLIEMPARHKKAAAEVIALASEIGSWQ